VCSIFQGVVLFVYSWFSYSRYFTLFWVEVKHNSHLSDHSCSACISVCCSSQPECWNIHLKAFVSSVNKYVSVPRLIISYMHKCDRSEHVTSFHSHVFAIYYFIHCFLPSIQDVIHLLKLYRYLVFFKLVYQSEMRYLIERLHKVAIYSAHSSTFIQNFRPFILYLQKL
jgi:hypothetical protein